MEVSPERIRAARALLRIGQSELARRAHVSIVTIRRIEAEQGFERVAPLTLDGVRRTLEEAGTEFIPGGVRRHSIDQARALALFVDLRAISRRSAERQRGRDAFTEADLHDENGLPA